MDGVPRVMASPPASSINFKERDLGEAARFLLPSLKLKSPPEKGSSAESRLHDFLMKNFGGYTAQAGNIFGYWRDSDGRDSYGEHREYTVALPEPSKLCTLKTFLAQTANDLGEECIYLIAGQRAFLIYPK
jgi:hypothetical protein